ncbi:type II CRISPR RNA-guided endonuclease Cas9 [Methylopila musalis]|uniref:CRISPR-associated endonuclease Cas9 n=1 Tax=Methylopila musalis TaxID=1134781 RepID=A0ABW3Z8Q8_9HYPH
MTNLAPKRPYRLGLDLGSNSLGWWMVWLDRGRNDAPWRPAGVGPGGVRIFEDGRDPQSGTSNASDRRLARGARVRRDRFLRRRRDLMAALIRHGLMPAEEAARKALEGLDPYRLRAEALDGPLPAHHVGRALFHLNQRRGFQSNRKTDAAGGEKGAIKVASGRLRELMEEDDAPTLGVWLWRRHQKREAVRSRAEIKGAKAEYAFYPTRDMLKHEFDAIWRAQAPHHATLTDAARDELFDTIFYQRPLKDPIVGKCSLLPATLPPEQDPGGYRCPLADPRAQRFRILQEVRNLRVLVTGEEARTLTPDESAAVLAAFAGSKEVKFDRLRTLLKLPAEAKFNLEDDKREKLLGDQTAAVLSDKKRFGKAWRGLEFERQCVIVERLLSESDEAALVEWLVEECGLDPGAAEAVADAPLPAGHSRLGLNALERLLPHMERGLNYPEAAAAEGLDHAHLPTGDPIGRLPHYGAWIPEAVVGTGDPNDPADKRFGRFPNPTVHIALGQLRRVVNALIDQHGAPTEIVIEFTRALKLSPDEKKKAQADQRKNQVANEKRAEEYRVHSEGAEPSSRDLLKMRLWEELNLRDPRDRKCPFTGKPIVFATLMSDEVEIEHLIPLGLSLDDSAANKTVCFREANRAKKKRTPWQAFGRSDGGYDWAAISERAANLPRNKRWRFEPDAHEKFQDMGGFLARQLNETGWLARFAKRYLSAVTDPYAIWVTPGRLTSIIRGKWGLNSLLPDHNYMGVKERDETFQAATDSFEFSGVKNRADHRHHAIDAFVMAMTDRSLLNQAAYLSGQGDLDVDKLKFPDFPDAWRDELKARVRDVVVSLKPDHGVGGKLHEDTAYGLVKPRPDLKPDEEERGNLVYRKPLESLKETEIGRIRDRRLREKVEQAWYEGKRDGKALPEALKEFADRVEKEQTPGLVGGLRRVRLLKSEKDEYLVKVADPATGAPYKAYSAGENFCIDVFETPDGRWHGEAVRRFDANQGSHEVRWRTEHPGAKLVMRVAKGDFIRLDDDGERKVMVAHRLEPSANRFRLAPHNETGNLERRHATADEIDPFKWRMPSFNTLKRLGAERVRVDELGQVRRVIRTRSIVGGVEGVDVLHEGWRPIAKGEKVSDHS